VDSVDTLVVDHHAARDLKFYEWVEERGVLTAGRYENRENPLEAKRRELWRGEEAQVLKGEKPP